MINSKKTARILRNLADRVESGDVKIATSGIDIEKDIVEQDRQFTFQPRTIQEEYSGNFRLNFNLIDDTGNQDVIFSVLRPLFEESNFQVSIDRGGRF